MIAAWTILQDVGAGFFGTEIPTSTVTMTAPVADDVSTTEIDESMSAMLSCYGDHGDFNEDDDGNPQYRCGLIPERHNNTITTEADLRSHPCYGDYCFHGYRSV